MPDTPHKFIHLPHPDAHIPGYDMPANAAPPLSRGFLATGFAAAVFVTAVGFTLHHEFHDVPDAHVPLAWVTPFVLLLACIAAMPFIAGHFWERHYNKVSVGLGLIVAAYYWQFVENGAGNIGRAVSEYVSFILLLGSLFVVSGGILIRVRARATPVANVALLLIGAVLANVLGTTGASMLLIRPFLRMNRGHLRAYHVVFFIFIVSNIGGSLTPIGDPPLFLGYLMGVPFFWVITHCWPFWATANGLLLTIFFVFDAGAARTHARTHYGDDDRGPAVSVYGATNLLFVAVVITGILGHDAINRFTHAYLGFEAPWREWLMAVAAFGSLATTPTRIHGDNHFNFAPIKEVAYLFFCIFLTMVPALNYLAHHGDAVPLTTPGHFYFACGGLSAVLDNAPTYLTFLKAELATRPGGMATLLADPAGSRRLVGLSMGAVLFGAMTYIGNGPNFMVRSIARQSGAEVPGFFQYVYAFALPILLPVLVLVWALFLRG